MGNKTLEARSPPGFHIEPAVLSVMWMQVAESGVLSKLGAMSAIMAHQWLDDFVRSRERLSSGAPSLQYLR